MLAATFQLAGEAALAKPIMTRHGKPAKRSAPLPESEAVLRMRDLLHGKRGITEKKMFGGTCFFANGNMIGGPTGRRELIVRVGPDQFDEALGRPHARPMDFTKRPMRGFVQVEPAGFASDEQLAHWIGLGLSYARSLPPK